MNFSKLKTAIELSDYNSKNFAKLIGISEQGFHQMFRNKSMKVDIFELIVTTLKLDPVQFFDSELARENFKKLNLDLKGSCDNCAELSTMIIQKQKDIENLLLETNKLKDQIIELMRK